MLPAGKGGRGTIKKIHPGDRRSQGPGGGARAFSLSSQHTPTQNVAFFLFNLHDFKGENKWSPQRLTRFLSYFPHGPIKHLSRAAAES